MAGALCGLLAGALGALGYTVACVNDGAGFVTAWYSLAVLLIAALGSALGRRFLRWKMIAATVTSPRRQSRRTRDEHG
ncbi:hypothetical protein C7E18_00315 [Stenotrophomonas maltophilia]|nr:hypothetical protein C7E18_00315 [Stenotrophomonas maltophilia]